MGGPVFIRVMRVNPLVIFMNISVAEPAGWTFLVDMEHRWPGVTEPRHEQSQTRNSMPG